MCVRAKRLFGIFASAGFICCSGYVSLFPCVYLNKITNKSRVCVRVSVVKIVTTVVKLQFRCVWVMYG